MTARLTSRLENGVAVEKAEFFKGWKDFAHFYGFEVGFILNFRLRREKGIFYVKVYDGTLCAKPWVAAEDADKADDEEQLPGAT